MALHPQCKAFLDQIAAGGGRPLHELSPAEARANAMPAELAGPEQPVHQVENRKVLGDGGLIPVRVYRPSSASPLPALIYFHGGGFVLGGLDMVDRTCRALANGSGCVVISVDYRLAPEHPFPAAADDAFAATQFVAEHAADFGIDPSLIAVGGDSAGGNLATVVALRARDAGGPALAFQLLVYPLVDFTDHDSGSMREYAEGHFLTTAIMDYFADHYLPPGVDRRQPWVSPLNANLAGLPPAAVLTAECDPLRDQGEAYARRLRDAGVTASLKRYDGMFHPFFGLGGIIDGAREAVADAAAALKTALTR
ncbi:MAG TPA: alpha/beta hydrolase [Vicinamibacterales bacterium]|jgi:acetyl esterase|nr:alpha/beta hydrolase [Vicinamibacterales bacterium]